MYTGIKIMYSILTFLDLLHVLSIGKRIHLLYCGVRVITGECSG